MESWDLHSQETGLKMFHGDTRIGGWDRRKHHLFILESYVRKLPDQAAARDVLRLFGFQLCEQPPGHFWWRVAEAEFGSFADALIALARLAPVDLTRFSGQFTVGARAP